MVTALRQTRPRTPGQPVLVAGDPERAAEEERRKNGIPIPETYLRALRGVAKRAGAPFLLDGK
jgi:LDH2 family malate/lactate/ureidoglycolate dehydrogenase